MRPGIIAKKIGMSNFYTPNGLNIPVTILHVDNCKVIERTEKPELDTDKVLLGACEIKKENKTNKSTDKRCNAQRLTVQRTQNNITSTIT